MPIAKTTDKDLVLWLKFILVLQLEFVDCMTFITIRLVETKLEA